MRFFNISLIVQSFQELGELALVAEYCDTVEAAPILVRLHPIAKADSVFRPSNAILLVIGFHGLFLFRMFNRIRVV